MSVAREAGCSRDVGKAYGDSAPQGSFNQHARACDPPLNQSCMQGRAGRCPERAREIGFREADVPRKICEVDLFGEASLKMIQNPFQAPGGHAAFALDSEHAAGDRH